ncbi:KR domain containing protein [Rhypophila sp. PSN 637]
MPVVSVKRGETSALESVLGAMGRLFCLGVPVDLRAVNTMTQESDDDIDYGTSSSGQSPCMLTNLPEYPFDHSRGYWHEGRLSKNYRLREHPPCEFLGVRDRNWDPADARWQHFIRFSEMPWAEQHVIDGSVLYPGTGMLAMAVEGARQLVEDQLCIRNKSSKKDPGYVIDGYNLSDVRFQAPLTLSPGSIGTEVQTCLTRVTRDGDKGGNKEEAATMYEFSIRTPPASTGDSLKGVVGEWTVNCRCFVSVQVVPKASGGHGQDWEGEQTRDLRRRMAETMSNEVAQMNDSMQPVDASQMYTFLREQCGYDYGPDYQALEDQHCLDPTNRSQDGKHSLSATAHVHLRREQEQQPVFHPATLDAILHLCFTAFSSGGTRPMATSIPSHISRMWISSRGLGWNSDVQSVLATSSIATETSRGFTARGGAFGVDRNKASTCSEPGVGTELALWYEGLELTAVGRIKSSSPSSYATSGVNPRQWFMNLDCKADVRKLTPQEVVAMLGDQEKEDGQQVEEMSRLVPKLDELIQASLQSLEGLIDQNPSLLQAEQDSSSSWRWRYWNWARHHHLGKSGSGSKDQESDAACSPEEKLQRLLSHIEPQDHPIGRVFTTVAKNLPAIFQGSIDPLQLLIHSGLLKDYYKELANYRCSRQAGRYMDLLAHQNPGMDILEVGGGTGSATRRMLHALAMPTSDSSTPRHLRCRLYHFTDISGAFAEAARDEFVPLYHPGQLAFSRLNIENDPREQGFGGSDSDARYDVIVADNVIHATVDLGVTLRNLRKLLKPGGKLLMHEPLRPDGGGLLGFVFGLFPGWWLGGEGGNGGISRMLSPTLPTDAWSVLLKQNGFSGVDMRFKDFDDEALHHLGWIVSLATNSQELSNGCNGTQGSSRTRSGFATTTIILDKTCQDQVILADHLSKVLPTVDPGIESEVEFLDINHDGMTAPNSTKLTILLSDYGTPFLRLADKPLWTRLKQIFRTTRHLLWVSSNSASSSNSDDITTTHPDQGLIEGMARSLRAEYYELHLVTLCLAAAPSPPVPSTIDSATRFIAQIASEMTQRTSLSDPYEQEYLESKGRLHTCRLVEVAAVKSAINVTLAPHRLVPISRQLQFFVPSKSEDMVLAPDSAAAPSATIVLRAIQIRPYHINNNGAIVEGSSSQGNTGNPEAPVPSFYCTGIVSNINTDIPNPKSDSPVLRPGDRVFGIIKVTSLTTTSDSRSFADACTNASFLATGYQREQENHNHTQAPNGMLGHDSSRGKKLNLDGLEIWTTASDGHERDWIVEHFGGDNSRVLPDGWFQGRSGPPLVEAPFDCVLSQSLEDKMQLESCVGRYLDGGCRVVKVCNQPSAASYGDSFWCHGGKRDISVGYLSMDDLEHVDNDAVDFAATHCLDRDMELLLPKWKAEEDTTNPGRRLLAHVPRQFMASEATAAFGHLNKSDGEAAGVVLEFGETDEIKVRVKNQVQHETLDPSAAYLIAGGLGGIGRFIASWLVSRGARYLILLSRSGPRALDSQTFLAEMASRGVHVEAPCCDITNTKMLRSILDDCATRMPPVKGCVQSVMVMKELILEKMEFEDWQAAVDGKVAGSWNLYQELLVQRRSDYGDQAPLDFFLLVSSMMGTIGGSSLSAYSAANSYMDALARYMVGQGHRAASIALGIVPDVGWLTDHTERLDAMSGVQKYAYTERNEIQALLEIFCRGPRDENNTFSMTRVDGGLLTSHTVTGVRPPSHWQDAEEVPFNMAQPLWGHMHHIPPLLLDNPDDDDGSAEQNNNRAGRERAQDAKARIRSAASISEAAEVAGEALVQRITSLLGAGNVAGGDKLDHRDLGAWQKPLHSYGIDSLSAIEIRSWVARVFDVDLAVFDILGGATVASCAMTIAAKVYGSVINGRDESRG